MSKNTVWTMALALSFFSTSSYAGDAPLREDVTNAARQGHLLQRGTVVNDIRLFELPGSGRSNDLVAEDILSDLVQRNIVRSNTVDRVEDFGDRFVMGGNDWVLSVGADGTEVSFRDLGPARNDPSIKALPKLPDAQISARARSFIEKNLAAHLDLGSAEGLEFWKTTFEHEHGAAEDGTEAYDRVVSNAALFTRTLDGIPVIGQGSKVEVELANDGAVIGFSFDWPQILDGTRRQTLAGSSLVTQRVASLFPTGQGTLLVPHHECGYFDPGSEYRDPYAPLQAACLTWVEQIRTNPESDGPIRSGVIVATPVGETIEYDSELEQSHPRLMGKLDGHSKVGAFGPSSEAARTALRRGH